MILDRSFAIAAGIAMLLATGIAMHQAVRASNLEADLERERTGYATAIVKAVNQARADERAQSETIQENSRAAQIQLTRQRDDAVSASAAVGRLRSRAAALAATACAPQDPAPSDGSPTAPDPAAVLADVLGRLAQAGGQLAVIADQRGTAGATCQLDYAAVAATAASAAGN